GRSLRRNRALAAGQLRRHGRRRSAAHAGAARRARHAELFRVATRLTLARNTAATSSGIDWRGGGAGGASPVLPPPLAAPMNALGIARHVRDDLVRHGMGATLQDVAYRALNLVADFEALKGMIARLGDVHDPGSSTLRALTDVSSRP